MDENQMLHVEPRRRRSRRSRKKPPVFWIGLALFAAVLVLFWAFVLGYVYRCMVTYEAAQPENLVAQVAQRMERDAREGGMAFDCTRFEDPERCREAYADLLEGRELSVRQSSASYDALAPVYEVVAGDQAVATVSLKEKSSKSLMFILTLQEWEITGITPVLAGVDPYVFTVPEGYTVQLNGVALDQRERTGNTSAIEELQYAANYVSVPTLVEYRVDGLLTEPDITILDSQGRQATQIDREGNHIRVERFESQEMPAQLRDYALKNAKDYSNFFSRDLAGSQTSVAPLRPMFPQDSYYLELAENYRLHDMWMYSGHNAPTFSDERVDHYVPYSDELFSCEVYFDKRMVLSRTGEERHDITHTRYYYVNLGGKWLIADMQQILDED